MQGGHGGADREAEALTGVYARSSDGLGDFNDDYWLRCVCVGREMHYSVKWQTWLIQRWINRDHECRGSAIAPIGPGETDRTLCRRSSPSA